MTLGFKKVAGAAFAALMLTGSVTAFSTPASAQYCRYHYCGHYHHGPGVVPLAAGLAAGILGTAAAVATGAGCWRHDSWGRAYRVC